MSIARRRYSIDEIDATLLAGEAWLPAEWEWACSLDHLVRVENCGIVGGRDAVFQRHYALTALAPVQGKVNQMAFRRLSIAFWHNRAIEQFLLAACLGLYAARPEAPYRGVRVAHLLPSWIEANDANYPITPPVSAIYT